MNDKDSSTPADRESIWSIWAKWRTAYFTLFVIQNTAGISLLCWYEIFQRAEGHAVQTALNIIQGTGQITVGSAGSSLTITEGSRLIMVLAHELERWFERRREKRDARVRAEGHTAGRVGSNMRWREWLERKNAAEDNGEPFDEPPPDISENGTYHS